MMTEEHETPMTTGHCVDDTEDSEVSTLDLPGSSQEGSSDQQQLNELLSRIAAVLAPSDATTRPGGGAR